MSLLVGKLPLCVPVIMLSACVADGGSGLAGEPLQTTATGQSDATAPRGVLSRALGGNANDELPANLVGRPRTIATVGERTMPAENAPTIQFRDDGIVTGKAGCNTYRARYRITENDLTILAITSSRKACPDPIMTLEADFLTALGAADRVMIDGDTLILLRGDQPLLSAR